MLTAQLQEPWASGVAGDLDNEVQRLYALCRRAGAALAGIEALAASLEAQAAGHEVWRVADASGAYCIEFSREGPDATLNPERDARQWFKAYRPYCEAHGYTVQKARQLTAEDRARLDVAAKLRALVAGAACA